MAGNDKINLQLRFNAEDLVAQRVLSILDLLPKKKNYAVLIALDEFFQKYKLYEASDKAVKAFIANYEYLHDMQLLFQPQAAGIQVQRTAEKVQSVDSVERIEKPKSTSQSLPKNTPAKPIIQEVTSQPSLEPKPTPPIEETAESTEATHFKDDPVISSSKKEKMNNMLKMFEY